MFPLEKCGHRQGFKIKEKEKKEAKGVPVYMTRQAGCSVEVEVP